MRFVLDTTVFLEVVENHDPSTVFGCWEPRVAAGEINFCDAVVDTLKSVDGGLAELWCKAVKATRLSHGAIWNFQEQVMRKTPDLADPSSESAPEVPVLAQALELRNNGDEVMLVTEDVGDRPLRQSLGEAANQHGIAVAGTLALLTDCGCFSP